MQRLSLLLLISTFLSACSVYKTQSSQNLENTKSSSCENISEIQYWYETRFPAPTARLIESTRDMEVWQIQSESGLVMQTFEVTSDFITRCVTPLTSPQDIQKFKDSGDWALEGETT